MLVDVRELPNGHARVDVSAGSEGGDQGAQSKSVTYDFFELAEASVFAAFILRGLAAELVGEAVTIGPREWATMPPVVRERLLAAWRADDPRLRN